MKLRVLITGGAHGIGRAMVEAFTEAGHTVTFCDINTTQGKELSRLTGAQFHAVDVTNETELEHFVQLHAQQWGDIDVIINNVGIGCFKPITEMSISDFDRVINTNLRPVFITSRALAILRHNATTPNSYGGRIINLCSTRYLMSEPGTEAYSASKGGIYSLTHALAMSLATYGITVNAIAPGWIHTNPSEELRTIDHSFHPSNRVGTPQDVARLALFLCQPQNNFINGETIVIDGGVTRKMIYPE